MPLPKKRKVKKTRKQKSSVPVLQRDLAKQAMIDREGFRQRLTELERELEEAQKDKKDIYEEMIRQYQQFQRQTDSQIQRLEAEKQNLQEELAACQKSLRQSEEERAKISISEEEKEANQCSASGAGQIK
ncbi:hypothetical protein E2320_007185 [Naja naja]|nr:hypothetical protein E2320_007185 [Naja naja]